MKLINNRFRVSDKKHEGKAQESLIVKDLTNKERVNFITILYAGRDQKAIDFFMGDFLTLSNIKHKNLVELKEFDIIKTINFKKTGSLTYYVLCEYIKSPKLVDIDEKLCLNKSLKIIIETMCVINYLHFRGHVYKHLSPTNIFLSPDNNIKLRDLASIYRDFIYSHHDYLTELFIAPEMLSSNEQIDKLVDYYSIGMLMKYLLFKDLHDEEYTKDSFKDELELTTYQQIFLLNTIKNLTHKDPIFRNISLIEHIENLNTTFGLGNDCELIKERNYLILNSKIVGREREVSALLDIDSELSNGIKKYNRLVISGRSGSGKTKLMNEIAHRFGLLNRNIIHIKGREYRAAANISIITLLKESFKLAPNELINKYRDDFSGLLNQAFEDDFRPNLLDFKSSQEKHRIYISIGKYFADLSKFKPLYILIDDLDDTSDEFRYFINYLTNKLEDHSVIIIISKLNAELFLNQIFTDNVATLIENNDKVLDLELNNLNEYNSGILIKSILGIDYVPLNFSSYVYKESMGNPNYIYYIIKDLYSREELYMSEKGAWETKEKDYSKIIIPIDENHVINSQLDNIGEDEYRVLELISLSKNMVTRELLKRVLNIEPGSMDDIIWTLLESKIIDVNIDGDNESISIYSTGFKRTVYSKISDDRRLDLHKKVAQVIMDLFEGDYEFIIEELLHHLGSSQQRKYALELVLKEARQQDNRYSDYSIFLWENASSLVEDTDGDERLNILYTLVNIYEFQGKVELLEPCIGDLIDLAFSGNNKKYLVKAKYHQAELALNSNQLYRVKEIISEITEIINEDANLIEEEILLLITKTKLGYSMSKYDHVIEDLNQAVRLSEDNDLLIYLGDVYNLYGIYYFLTGVHDKAIEFFNKSIKYYDKTNNIVGEFKPLNNIGNIYAHVYSHKDKALEFYHKGYEIANKYGLKKASATLTNNIGDIYYNNFDVDKALEYMEVTRNISNEIGGYKGIVISNLILGLIYLRLDDHDKVDEVYSFIKRITSKETMVDNEILIAYYKFMGKYNYYYGRFEEALDYYNKLSQITKDSGTRDYLMAKAQMVFIKGTVYSEYDRDILEDIVSSFEELKLNNLELEMILYLAIVAAMNDDIDFAKRIIKICPSNEDMDNEGLRALRDAVDTRINPTKEKLVSLEVYEDMKIPADYKLNINLVLSIEWERLKVYRKSINHCFKALDNNFRRVEKIKDRSLRYSFMKHRYSDQIKSDLSKYIKLEFDKDIDYLTLDKAIEDNIRYNDLINIMNQLGPDYREIRNLDNEYEQVDSIEVLLDELSDDYQNNLDLILNYLGYEIVAKRGFILAYDEDDRSYRILSSLIPEDKDLPKENILAQSIRSSVGILINRNLKNMRNSRYIEFLPTGSVGVVCVPVTRESLDSISFDRRKKNSLLQKRNNGLFKDKSKIFIYFESDSYLNKFEYDKLLLINHVSSLIHLNIENKNLKEITIVDKLTGVMTRNFFDQQIEDIIQEYDDIQGSFSLLMVDIDNFKEINDNYGHLVGDDVLSLIGDRLLKSVRNTDIIARYGGEEFIIILLDTSIDEGKNIADKIRKSISEIQIANVKRGVSVSVGLAQYPVHGHLKRELIGKADQALYIAKEKSGKNSTVAWDINMGEGTNIQDKLAGIISGNINKDNRNITAVIDILDLVESEEDEFEKIAKFTDYMLDLLEAQYATFIKYNQDSKEYDHLYEAKIRNIGEWVKTPRINANIIDRVIHTKKGEFFTDWDSLDNLDPFTQEPILQSVLILPSIKNGQIVGLIYLSVPLKEKEFTFEDFNFGNLLSKIFTLAIT